MGRVGKVILWMSVIMAGIYLGITVFDDRKYWFVSLFIAIVSCIMVYGAYEHTNGGIRRMVIIAVMVSMAVAGRAIFAPLPGFKPVTAIVVIAAVYLGIEAGFVVGSMTALVSDLFFTIGPWTPFQMCAWGMIGAVAGIPWIRGKLKQKKWMLLYGAVAGIAYSLLMDIWTVLSVDQTFNSKKYAAAVMTSLPFMFLYSSSNVVFLFILMKPIGKKLERMNKKHCIF